MGNKLYELKNLDMYLYILSIIGFLWLRQISNLWKEVFICLFHIFLFRLIKKLFHLPIIFKKKVEAVAVKSVAIKKIFAVISFNVKIQNLKNLLLGMDTKWKSEIKMNVT